MAEKEKQPAPSRGVLVSVNLAQLRQVPMGDLLYDTGIWKLPVDRRVPATDMGLDGDMQGDLSSHGGPTKAVYAYAEEDYLWWEAQLGRTLPPGTFGENLTLRGIPVTGAHIGERWLIGSAEFEVTQPRQPCWKLGLKMEDQKFPNRFSEANRPGAYLSILKEGEVGSGDAVEVLHRPAHPVTIGLLAYLIYTDHRLAALLMEMFDQDLTSDQWREFLKAKLAS